MDAVNESGGSISPENLKSSFIAASKQAKRLDQTLEPLLGSGRLLFKDGLYIVGD
jgi:hypothetical protein